MKKKYYTFKLKLYLKILKWYKDYYKQHTLLKETINILSNNKEVDYYMEVLYLVKYTFNNQSNNEVCHHYKIDNMGFWRERWIKNIVDTKTWYQEYLINIDIPIVTICIDGCSISNKPEDQMANKFDVYA
jgi:hypothetical protein